MTEDTIIVKNRDGNVVGLVDSFDLIQSRNGVVKDITGEIVDYGKIDSGIEISRMRLCGLGEDGVNDIINNGFTLEILKKGTKTVLENIFINSYPFNKFIAKGGVILLEKLYGQVGNIIEKKLVSRYDKIVSASMNLIIKNKLGER